ncbi:hypothetical protein N7451_002926 [Penicillium sp. IBT 35674x]|nr:hypothetical protein N7451_002926 [Penicillium sp. IBT 35674x]
MRCPSRATLIGANPKDDHLHQFETSWLLSPLVLACLRGLIALYIFTTIIVIWIWYGTHDDRVAIGESFSYFTWLTYWGLGFYFLVSTIHTALYARTGRSVLFDRWPRACRVLHGLLYASITTYPFLVTIVFWGLLFKPPFYKITFLGWSNISQHGLNSFYALLEIFLPATAPHPWIGVPVLILVLLFYLCVAYITYYDQGWWTYSFLNTEHGKKSGIVAAYCFGILAAILVIFCISMGLIWVRRRLTGDKRKRSPQDILRHEFAAQNMDLQMQSSEMKKAIV